MFQQLTVCIFKRDSWTEMRAIRHCHNCQLTWGGHLYYNYIGTRAISVDCEIRVINRE